MSWAVLGTLDMSLLPLRGQKEVGGQKVGDSQPNLFPLLPG